MVKQPLSILFRILSCLLLCRLNPERIGGDFKEEVQVALKFLLFYLLVPEIWMYSTYIYNFSNYQNQRLFL